MQTSLFHKQLIKQLYNKYSAMRLYLMPYKIGMNFVKFGHFFFRIKKNCIYIFKIPVYRIRKYDTVISVGAACFVPSALTVLKLRDFSGPFDWMYGSDVITRLKCIYDEFNHYFDYSDFEYVDINPDNNKAVYKNNRTGIYYNHDFEPGDFAVTFPPIAEKYARRTTRMLEHLNNDKRVLLVFSELGQTGDKNEIIKIIDKINAKFNAKIDFLYINHNPDMRPGIYTKPKRISKNVIYCEYYYKTYPTETDAASRTLLKVVTKIAK